MNASLLKPAIMGHACWNVLLVKFHAPKNVLTLIVTSTTAENVEKSAMPDLMPNLFVAREHAPAYANRDGLIRMVTVTVKPAALRAKMRFATESTITAMETWMKALNARWAPA